MPRGRTIKGPVKRGTITERQARAVAKEILEERYGRKEDIISSSGPTANRSARSGKYHRSTKRSSAKKSTSTKSRT